MGIIFDYENSTITVDKVELTGEQTFSIDQLVDVDTTTQSPSSGQTLIWNGTNWAPDEYNFVSSINDLTDVDISTNPPQNGESLIWDAPNSKFVPGVLLTTIDGGAASTIFTLGQALVVDGGNA